MPLPLYGSGFRSARTAAANWPTFCLSIPWMTMCCWSGHGHLQPVGDRHLQLVGQADAELQHLALHGGQVADALDLQPLLVALGDADDHVDQQGPGQPVQGAALALVVAARLTVSVLAGSS